MSGHRPSRGGGNFSNGGGGGGGGGNNGPRGGGRGGSSRGGSRGRGRGAASGGGGGGGGGRAEGQEGNSAGFSRGGARGGRGGRGGRGQHSDEPPGTVVQLSGLPSDLAYTDLVTFVNNHAFQGFRYTRLIMTNSTARLTCARTDDANQMLGLLHGKSIRPGFVVSAAISSSVGGGGVGRSLQQSERDQLRSHIRTTYDANSKTLNLMNLQSVPTLSHFVNFSSLQFNQELLNAIHAHASDCKSLNLAGNQIQNLANFTRMPHVLPHLQNLSLANNYIASLDQLDHLAVMRDKLHELVLTANPFLSIFTPAPGSPPVSATTQCDYGVYQNYVSGILPALKILDGHPLAPLISFDLPDHIAARGSHALPPEQGSYFDPAADKRMVHAFVTRFFEVYDRDRQERDLISVYADHALFSLTYQPEARYSSQKYVECNRNIAIMPNQKLRVQHEISLLKQGPVAIVSALHNLPSSQHDRDSLVADVMQVTTSTPKLAASAGGAGGVLVIVVRGSFLEDGTVIRSFHRTLMCSPPSPEARAKGWPVSIIHDTLYIGAAKHTGTLAQAAAQQAQSQQSSVVIAAPSASSGAMPSSSGMNIPPLTLADQQLVQSLATQAAVNFETAKVMLFQCQGDVHAAMNQITLMRQQGQLQ